MDNEAMFQTTAIIDIDDQIRKEEELLNTIKMEPIIEKTVIEEEPVIAKKKKMMKITDYCLLSLIVVLSVVFILVIINVR